MKALLVTATLLLATSTLAQQQAHPPYAPPPHETPPYVSGEQNPPPMHPEANPGQMPPDTKAPVSQQLSTKEIQQQVQQKLDAEPLLAGNNLVVIVDDQSVTVAGTVDSESERNLVLRVAQSYAGNRSVVDKLEILQKS